ncbi:MAG: TonB-dependent receptor [Niabella sp.]
MRRIILLYLAVFVMQHAFGQSSFKTIVKDKESGSPVSDANVAILNLAAARTDHAGFAEIANIPAGKHVITWSHTGYAPVTDTVIFPLQNDQMYLVELEEAEEALEEVIVESTRTGRTIANTPTRIETIDGEELDEKNNMRPANVSMLLHESTGIHVQQTSATSANAGLRIQGLDGSYTQLLKDGYASFGSFASGLSILEIPPLDLKQVEVIKGPASTLYGGGAIAGVVNFISKMPGEAFEGDIMLNQSNIGQTNIGGYFSQRGKKMGYAILGLLNLQKAYDVDKDDFSELPENSNFTINPRFFFYPGKTTTITLGNSLTASNNTGGDMHVIKGNAAPGHVYYERNKTLRNTALLELLKNFTDKSSFKLKQSITVFNRDIEIPGYQFSGKNLNSFTDLSYLFYIPGHTMIGGANFVYDRFDQQLVDIYDSRSATAGAYFQDTWDLSDKVKLESGLRADHIRYSNTNFKKNESFLLPRISALLKLSNKVSSRLGGGLGYKIPGIFTERAESMQYRDIMALDNVEAEKSAGATADVNYKTKLGEAFSLSANQLFFYSKISKPLVLEKRSDMTYMFANANKPVISKGFETNVRLVFKDVLKLFAGYTFTDVRATYLRQNQVLPLMPRHKINAVLMYEKEDNFKLGLEGYHNGAQYLYNGTRTPFFREFGFMAQKTFGKISVFINFENFTDERQSNYKRVVNGSLDNPSFDDIWNHTEGRVINGGIKIRL